MLTTAVIMLNAAALDTAVGWPKIPATLLHALCISWPSWCCLLQLSCLPKGRDVLSCVLVNKAWNRAQLPLLPPVHLGSATAASCVNVLPRLHHVEADLKAIRDSSVSQESITPGALLQLLATALMLQTLVIHRMQYQQVPDELTSITKLRQLDLINGTFSQLPNSLTDLQQLESFSSINCPLHALPPNLQQLTALTKYIPQSGRVAYIHQLWGRQNPSTAGFDDELPTGLRELSVSQCVHFTYLPSNFGYLTALESLTVSGYLDEVPDNPQPAQLTSLGLDSCDQLRTLPGAIQSSISPAQPHCQLQQVVWYHHNGHRCTQQLSTVATVLAAG